VGGGPNSCVLHYRDNNQTLRDGELLLVDAGCEYECYASDITRTFPVNGRFSPEQRAVYEIVLEANEAAHRQSEARQSLERAPRGRGSCHHAGPGQTRIAQRTRAETGARGALTGAFFMHRTGHWLGMDVHDVGDYKRSATNGVCWNPAWS